MISYSIGWSRNLDRMAKLKLVEEPDKPMRKIKAKTTMIKVKTMVRIWLCEREEQQDELLSFFK